jgi:hypothetical protein
VRCAALLLLAVLLAPAGAAAQVAAPALVEEDLADDAAPPAAPASVEPSLPPGHEEAAPARPAPAAPARPAEPPLSHLRTPVAVRARFEDLHAAWHERRGALREHEVARAAAAEARLLDVKAELAIDELPDFAAAELRASARALEARDPAEALARAELAAKLAPGLPDVHVARARAALARDPARVGEALRDLAAAARATVADPRARRAVLADALAAALGGALATAALVLALLLGRHARLALHDARHLPLVRLGTPAQAAFLALAALALPLAFRLGPLALLLVLALASAPYLARSERLLATAALLAVAALPWGAEGAARLCAFTGTLADDVWQVERGADGGPAAARLEALAARGELPPPGLLALAHHRKRRGDLDGAARLYEAAGLGRADALVGLGNVQLLRGDEEGARASYLAATDRAGADLRTLAAAHYDLSQIYLRHAALDQAHEARKRAAQEDPALLDRYGGGDDLRANRWLADVPVPEEEIAALAADGAPRALADAVRARLAGPLGAAAWPWAPLAAVAALWAAALVRRRAAVSARCERCGGAACARCGAADRRLCGQCLNAFVKRGAVDARDRLRKDAEVRRRARAGRAFARALALVAGGAGWVWRGAPWRGALSLFALASSVAAALLWRGAAPTPHAAAWTVAARAALAAAVGVAAWAVAVRGVFRQTRA